MLYCTFVVTNHESLAIHETVSVPICLQYPNFRIILSYPGVILLPTQTMHVEGQIPQNDPRFALFHSSYMESHLMTPVISKVTTLNLDNLLPRCLSPTGSTHRWSLNVKSLLEGFFRIKMRSKAKDHGIFLGNVQPLTYIYIIYIYL